jgi:hypothetical protein
LRDLLNVQRLEVRDAPLGEFPILLNKIILNAASFCGGECFLPIDAALAHCNLRYARARLVRMSIVRVGQIWLPIGKPKGVAFRYCAFAATIPAAAVFLIKSRLEIFIGLSG